MELAGELSHGTFRRVESGVETKGEWQLSGHDLRMEASDGRVETYDLRFFEAGRIGLRAGDADARLYVKTPSNVVPLRRGSG